MKKEPFSIFEQTFNKALHVWEKGLPGKVSSDKEEEFRVLINLVKKSIRERAEAHERETN